MGGAGAGAEEEGRAASKGTQIRENRSQVLYRRSPTSPGWAPSTQTGMHTQAHTFTRPWSAHPTIPLRLHHTPFTGIHGWWEAVWSVPILRVTENPLTPLPPGMRQGEGPLLAGGPTPALTVGSSVPAESGPAWRIPRRRAPPAVRLGCSRAEAGTWADTPASLRFLFHHLQPFLWLLWLPHLKDDSNVECLAQGRRASQCWTLWGALSQPFRARPLHIPSNLGQTVQQAAVKGRQRVFNALAVSILPPGEWARAGGRAQGLHERLKR